MKEGEWTTRNTKAAAAALIDEAWKAFEARYGDPFDMVPTF